MDTNQQKEDLQTLILRCDENIQRIEDRLDSLNKKFDDDLQAYIVRSQLEFVLLNTLENKFNKEQQLRGLKEQEQWMKDHPVPTMPSSMPGMFVPPGYTPMAASTGTINPDDVESTIMFHHKTNANLGNVVFKMKAGIYLDPISRSVWNPTEDWVEQRSTPGMSL